MLRRRWGDDLGAALANVLGSLETKPHLLGLGEPTHGEEEFPLLRNEVFRQLVEREGYRSVAIESDCLAALRVDAFVREGESCLDGVMETGFSHGFGGSEANRELVAWMRDYNRRRDSDDRLTIGGDHDAMIAIRPLRQTVTDLVVVASILDEHVNHRLEPRR